MHSQVAKLVHLAGIADGLHKHIELATLCEVAESGVALGAQVGVGNLVTQHGLERVEQLKHNETALPLQLGGIQPVADVGNFDYGLPAILILITAGAMRRT